MVEMGSEIRAPAQVQHATHFGHQIALAVKQIYILFYIT